MTKALLLIVVLFAVYLFYPFRDLYVKEDPFSSEYVLAGKDFWTRRACMDAAEAQHAKDYYCRKRTNLSGLLGTSSRYVNAHTD